MTTVINWEGVKTLSSKSYKCGYCGESLSSEKGYFGQNDLGAYLQYIFICHHCYMPTHFSSENKQSPGCIFGNYVNDINDSEVNDLFEEARRCTSSNSFTATILCCRKLLMHIAVKKGANEGETFIKYVEYLSNHHFIPPGAKDWVDHIRQKGNEANHEITIMSKADAEDLVSFCEMLLKLVYEFPANIAKKRIII